MNPTQNIHVATDFSHASELAVQAAPLLAQRNGARVTLVHVLDVDLLDDGDLEQVMPETRSLEVAVHEHLDRLRTEHLADVEEVKTVLLRSKSAAEAILRVRPVRRRRPHPDRDPRPNGHRPLPHRQRGREGRPPRPLPGPRVPLQAPRLSERLAPMDRTAARSPNSGDLVVFLAIAFGGSWGLAGLCALLGFHLGGWHTYVIGVPYMLFPALGALVAERRRGARVRSSLAIRFRPNTWWIVGWLGALAVAWLAVACALLLPGVHFIHSSSEILDALPAGLVKDPAMLAQVKEKLAHLPRLVFVATTSAQALVAGATVNALAAFGEELGWRGYLQRAVSKAGFWKGSWLVGLVWGLWHGALIIQGYNYPEHPRAGIALMTVLTVLLAPLFAAVRLRGRSVIASSIAHGTVNATAGIPAFLVLGGNDITKGITGVAGFVALAVANVVLFLWLRGHTMPDPDADQGPAGPPQRAAS